MSEKFVFQRTAEVLGVAPHKAIPITEEFEIIKSIKPTQLTKSAQLYLQTKFQVTKSSDLASNAVYLVLGNPRYELNKGVRLVVSDVLNKDIPGWGPVTEGKDAIVRNFGDSDTAPGLYLGNQVYVHKEDEGQGFFDNLSAATLSPFGILFNSHADNYSNSVFHEVFHTFQGNKLTGKDIFKEGIVELISVMFAKDQYGVDIEYYPGYAEYIPDAQKLVAFTSKENVAKAFFMDDEAAIQALVPLFYKPISDSLPATQQLSPGGMIEGKQVPSFGTSGYLGQFSMKEEGSWYRKWVALNGGTIPKGGLVLPVKKALVPLGGRKLPIQLPKPLDPPPLISPTRTPELSQGSGVPPLVKNIPIDDEALNRMLGPYADAWKKMWT